MIRPDIGNPESERQGARKQQSRESERRRKKRKETREARKTIICLKIVRWQWQWLNICSTITVRLIESKGYLTSHHMSMKIIYDVESKANQRKMSMNQQHKNSEGNSCFSAPLSVSRAERKISQPQNSRRYRRGRVALRHDSGVLKNWVEAPVFHRFTDSCFHPGRVYIYIESAFYISHISIVCCIFLFS